MVLNARVPLLRGAAVVLHAHAAKEAAHVTNLIATLDGKTGEVAKQRPRCLTQGQSALVEVTLDRPVALERCARHGAT